jgi:hypothetical protein
MVKYYYQPELHNPLSVFHGDAGKGRNTQFGTRQFNTRYDILTMPIGVWLVYPTNITMRSTRNSWGGFLDNQSHVRMANTKELAILEVADLKDNYGIDATYMPFTVNVEVGSLAGINTTQLGDVKDDLVFSHGDFLRWDEGKPVLLTLNEPISVTAGDIIYQRSNNVMGTVLTTVVNSVEVTLVNVRGLFSVLELDSNTLEVQIATTNAVVDLRPVKPISAVLQTNYIGNEDYASFHASSPNNYGSSPPINPFTGDIWFNTSDGEGDLLVYNGDAWVEAVPRIHKDTGAGVDMSAFANVATSGDYNDLFNLPSGGGGGGSGGTGDTVVSTGYLGNPTGAAILDPVAVPSGNTIVLFSTQPKFTEAANDYVAVYETGGTSTEYALGVQTVKWRNTSATSKDVRLFLSETQTSGSQGIYIIYSNTIIDASSINSAFSTVATTGDYNDLINKPGDIDVSLLDNLSASFYQSTAPTQRDANTALSDGDFWTNSTTDELNVWNGTAFVSVSSSGGSSNHTHTPLQASVLTTGTSGIDYTPPTVSYDRVVIGLSGEKIDTSTVQNQAAGTAGNRIYMYSGDGHSDVSVLELRGDAISSSEIIGGKFTTPAGSGTNTITLPIDVANKKVLINGFNFHSTQLLTANSSGEIDFVHGSSSDPETWYWQSII